MPLTWLPPEDCGVYRTHAWPSDELRGVFFVTDEILRATQRVLVDYGTRGGPNRGHEGLVFWMGRAEGECTRFLQVVAPTTDHGFGHVNVGREQVGEVARTGRHYELGLLSQIHSHPGDDARHSDGDDDMILLPFEGMLSIVVPDFGRSFISISQARVHQFQGGQWVLCTETSVARQFVTVPTLVDLR